MAIPAECDYCGHQYRIQQRFAGEELPCKHCGEYFLVPNSSRDAKDYLPPRRGTANPSRSDFESSGNPQWLVALAVAAVVIVGGGVLLWSIASKSSDEKADPAQVATAGTTGDGSELFPVASIPVPQFPNQLPQPRRHASGAEVYFVDLKHTPGNGSTPGSQMAMRVYLPAGEHAPRSLGCVLVAPAGSNLLRGNPMDADDYHEETLPYVHAGYAVVFYSIDGILDDPDNANGLQFARAYQEFKAAHAGVVNGRNALEFALAKLPAVDPGRIYSAGHSSAGVLSLLLAEHEPRIKGCIAYAPATDVELRLKDITLDPNVNIAFPDIKAFLKQSSPKTHAEHLNCPVFLFHARDDSNEPIHTTEAFASLLADEGKQPTFRTTPTGDHYDSMIETGIPQGIAWLKELPTEQGKTYPAPAVEASNSNPPAETQGLPSNLPSANIPPVFPRFPPFEPPAYQPPSFPGRMPIRPGQRIMVFEMQSYSGTGDAGEAAKRVLRRYPWCDANSVKVDFEAKQVVIGLRGGSVNSGPVKSGLEGAGFQLGGVSVRTQQN